ncbi:hypothetical protein MBBA_0065 [Methanoculleus bourgensis]|nr:hypothetical protein MBBA_0065 [Methanoculleus bourgensis]
MTTSGFIRFPLEFGFSSGCENARAHLEGYL